jgi:hypothetical protein
MTRKQPSTICLALSSGDRLPFPDPHALSHCVRAKNQLIVYAVGLQSCMQSANSNKHAIAVSFFCESFARYYREFL